MNGAPEPERAAARPQVIYVMGAGRSGSTTLGITLGNCPGVFYAGELDNWLVRSGVPQVEDEQRMRFWAKVRSELEDPGRAARAVRQRVPARDRADGVGAARSASGRLGCGSAATTEPWPRTSTGRSCGPAARVTSPTPPTIRCAHASCSASRGSTSTWCTWSETRRAWSPRSTAATSRSSRSRPLHTNVYLWATHALSLLVFLRHPRERRLYVRYEDFVADPAAVLGRILA